MENEANQSFSSTNSHYLITLTIPEINSSQAQNQAQYTCYVYLGEKIQDVRGVSNEETRIKIPSIQDINRDLLKLNIQVKLSPTAILGYLSLSLVELLNYTEINNAKWFPLSASKENAKVSFNQEENDDLQKSQSSNSQGISKVPQILVDIQVRQVSPSKYSQATSQPSMLAQQQEPSPPKEVRKGNERTDLSVSPIYEIDLDNSQYDEPKDNSNTSQGLFNLDDKQYQSHYTNKSKGDSPQQVSKSQVIIKKKKNFTQSANPTIGLIKSPERGQVQVPTIVKLDSNLLATPQPKTHPIVIRNSLLEDINKGISGLHEKADKALSDINLTYNQVKQISSTDQQDLVKYSDRDQLVKRIGKVTQQVVSKKQEQNFNRQQFEQQVKDATQNPIKAQKEAELNEIKNVNNILRNEIHHQIDSNSQNVQSLQSPQLTEQIKQAKKQLISTLEQIKSDLLSKPLASKVQDDADEVYNTQIEAKQVEHKNQQDELVKANRDTANSVLQLDHQSHEITKLAKHREFENDKKKVELSVLTKKVQSTTSEIKQVDKLYSDIINKLRSKRKGQVQHSDQLKFKINEIQQELIQNQEALVVQKQRLSENEFERANDPQCLSNKDILANYNKLQENLAHFMEQIKSRQQHVQELKDIWQSLKTDMDQNQIDALFSSVVGAQDQLSEKNLNLLSKIQLLNEFAQAQDQLGVEMESHISQQQIQDQFKKAYNVLLNKEKELKDEYQRIKVAANEIVKIREEIEEKISIQEKDFEDFGSDNFKLEQDSKKYEDQQNQINRQLISIKSKSELENELRDKVSQIRELEAILRGKDHEIDTLELIQSQKDSVILELEEQAGRFKEVVKEVRYESTKKDRVEEELFRYMDTHPVKVMIKKLGDGYYKFGTKRIYIKLDEDDETLMVRIGPKEFTTLNAFIIENEGVELQKSAIGKSLVAKLKL